MTEGKTIYLGPDDFPEATDGMTVEQLKQSRLRWGGAAMKYMAERDQLREQLAEAKRKGKLEIELLHHSHDCETCGSSYSQGARISLDGKVIQTLQPRAHCFDGDNWEDLQIMVCTLVALGYDVSIKGEGM